MDEWGMMVAQMVEFFRWVVQTMPDACHQVGVDQGTLASVPEDGDSVHLAALRDAAYRLCGLATQGGFEGLASLYYQDYEWACVSLAAMGLSERHGGV